MHGAQLESGSFSHLPRVGGGPFKIGFKLALGRPVLLGPAYIGKPDARRLPQSPGGVGQVRARKGAQIGAPRGADAVDVIRLENGAHGNGWHARLVADPVGEGDRKRVVWGKRVAVQVALDGRRSNKKKKKK